MPEARWTGAFPGLPGEEGDLRVVHVATHDVSGGAARSAWRLHQGLLGEGVHSTMFVRREDSGDPTVRVFRPRSDLPARAARWLRRRRIRRDFRPWEGHRPPGLERFTDDRTPFGPEVPAALPPCDLVNLHWVADFVDYRCFLGALPPGVPVVWTLHDMNPFTGGCHYDEGCGRFTGSCGACPSLGSSREEDLSRDVWTRKREAFRSLSGRLRVVTPSRWLAEEARRSSLLGSAAVDVIPYGLDLDVFRPLDRAAARRELEVPDGARVLLFVAAAPRIRRKGFRLLTEALERIRDVPDLFLLWMGTPRGVPEVPVPDRALGFVDEDREVARAYAAADLFVIPSLQDNLPNTVVESLACGTPVVGFDAGGIPDMVRPGETGALARVGDPEDLARALRELLADDEGRSRMATRCRAVAEAEYPLRRQARRYLELYDSLLERPAPVRGRA